MAGKSSVMEFLYNILQAFKLHIPVLHGIFSKLWKIPEIVRTVEFIFTETGANRFSTE